jgi:neutral ceramidase
MSKQSASGFRVGFAKRDITPAAGTPLAGRPTLRARQTQSIRDPLYARALHVESDLGRLTIIVADLCLITSRMHAAIAKAANIAPESLHVCATHTHSATGCYWRGNLVERFMGPFDQEVFSQLVNQLAQVGLDAFLNTSAGRLSASSVRLSDASVNRREHEGAVDHALSLLKFDVEGGQPICVVSFGAHAVGGVELEPFTMTADYPGEVCRRLETCGYRPLFLLGAAGGTSPGWLNVSLNDHINRMGDAIQHGIERAEKQLTAIDGSTLRVRTHPLEASANPCRLLPEGTRHKALLDVLSLPLRALVDSMARQGFQDNQGISLNFAQLGELALFGVPCEIGPGVSQALRDAIVSAGYHFPLIVSMCNGYSGYAHLPCDYQHHLQLPPLKLYENAMSFAGWDFGERIVSTARASLSLL